MTNVHALDSFNHHIKHLAGLEIAFKDTLFNSNIKPDLLQNEKKNKKLLIKAVFWKIHVNLPN